MYGINLIALKFLQKLKFKNKQIWYICIYYYSNFKIVAVECTDIEKYLKRKTVEVETAELEYEKAAFTHGLIYLNLELLSNPVRRYPSYRFKRFNNKCDVEKAFPKLNPTQVKEFLNKNVNFRFNFYDVFEHQYNDPLHPDFMRTFDATLDRVHHAAEIPTNSENNLCDLSQCSPWLSKEKPKSVKQSEDNPGEGNIYTNITAYHNVANDYVVVQEKYEYNSIFIQNFIGYCPSAVLVKATVAFPPICEGEIWTIGWIQGVKKDLIDYYYDRNRRLFVFKTIKIIIVFLNSNDFKIILN